MALSDAAVRHAKATGKDYTLPDFDGLTLFVSATGTKAWYFRYYWLGRQKRMSFGPYPEIGLREARIERDKARALVAKGINPQRQRMKDRRLATDAEQHTFQAVYDKWLQFRQQSRLKKTGRNVTLGTLPLCSSSFCRRGVASSAAADPGRINPFGRSVAGGGDGAAATGGRFRWNRESMSVS